MMNDSSVMLRKSSLNFTMRRQPQNSLLEAPSYTLFLRQPMSYARGVKHGGSNMPEA
jgi:hypothetical protein